MFEDIWEIKYAPKTLDEMVLTNEVRTYFQKLKETKIITNHFLFCGYQGIGKTTLAKIIATDVLDVTYLYINASDERGIDTIRNKITSFAQTRSIDGKIKIIILDECLDENTLVTILRDGETIKIPIKDLHDNTDLVKSYNIKTNLIEWRTFKLLEKDIQEVYEIVFENNEKVYCTIDHKWYFKDEDGKIRKEKLKYIIDNNIKEIFSPEADKITS